MLVQRWSILWSAIPSNISLKKSIALVHALAWMHNFCINQQLENEEVPETTATDMYTLMTNVNGYVPLEVAQMQDGNNNVVLPTQLLGSGDHFDDVPLEAHSRRVVSAGRGPTHQAGALPRSILHDHVAQSNQTRPRLS
jgi:hypothetical protein